jgi:hypothetical protein
MGFEECKAWRHYVGEPPSFSPTLAKNARMGPAVENRARATSFAGRSTPPIWLRWRTWAARPHGLSGNSFRSPGLVRRTHVGELREQVFVGPDPILRHLSIGKERKEEIYDVVG